MEVGLETNPAAETPLRALKPGIRKDPIMLSNDPSTKSPGKSRAGRVLQTAVLAIVWLLAGPALFAESGLAADPVGNQGQSGNPDFNFSTPKGFLGIRIGRLFPEGDSDLFKDITDDLTLEESDFRAWDIGFDGGVDLQERVELIFSFDYSRRTKASEFRNYVDSNGLPITQTTRLQQIPLTGGVKLLLVPRGRQVGRYAWLPSSVVPYIGGGAGVLWYRFEQEGDFVDEFTYEIFPAHLESSGWAPTAYAGGGADIHVVKTAFITLDLRYVWAKPELGRDFVSYDNLDLSGFRVSAGLQWHF
jgi:hypothetical protein